MSRPTRTVLTDVIAECHGCAWVSNARNAVGNAARHHDASGHEVAVSVTRLIYFGDADQGRRNAGQTTLEEALAG